VVLVLVEAVPTAPAILREAEVVGLLVLVLLLLPIG